MKTTTVDKPLGRLSTLNPLVRTGAGGVVSMIRSGVPVKLAERLATRLDMPKSKIFALLGVAERTMPRRLAAGLLKPVESDRFYRIDRMVALAEEAFGDALKARKWLKRPNRVLGGETPIEFLDTEAGALEVDNLLQQIKHGLFV